MPVSLEEYFRTTFEDKLLVKLPEREDEHLTPATRLLEKRREMTEVEQVGNYLMLMCSTYCRFDDVLFLGTKCPKRRVSNEDGVHTTKKRRA